MEGGALNSPTIDPAYKGWENLCKFESFLFCDGDTVHDPVTSLDYESVLRIGYTSMSYFIC